MQIFRCGNAEKALTIFNSIFKDRLGQTIRVSFSSSSSVGNMTSIVELFQSPGYEMLPNVRTYNTLLKGLRGLNQLDKCFALYSSMEKNGVQADAITLNTLIDACVSGGNVLKAKKVYSSTSFKKHVICSYITNLNLLNPHYSY